MYMRPQYICLCICTFAVNLQDILYIVPTERLLQELQLDSFRSECKATFGVELPDTRLLAPEGDDVEGGASDTTAAQLGDTAA